MSNKQRIIGRWTIGDTLAKGNYSWIKRGQDIKTGKIVALKFVEKSVGLVKEQVKQIETEIEALRNVRHPNVRKLYAYNLNAQYPLASEDDIVKDNNNQKYIDTILLVSEYIVGGELFDILYYTSALRERVARTFFKQTINGLEACHNAHVIHRNLKPQNLLLDINYNLKITGFGICKIIRSDADIIMQTVDIGTHQYDAPEILLNQKYDMKCDIFSAGVILFILLAGYPPFEQASKKDKWYKPLLKGNIDKFWKAHQKSQLGNNLEAKDLVTKMLTFDPKKRIDTNNIKSHKWFKGETLTKRMLIIEMSDRYRKAEKKRRQDVRKMNDLAQSLIPRWSPGIEKAELKQFPAEYIECVLFGEAYTYLDYKEKWYDLYNCIEEAITGKGRGKCDFNFEKGILNCEINVARDYVSAKRESREESRDKIQDTVKFDVQIFESRVWKDRYKELNESDAYDIFEQHEHEIFVVKITRTEGNVLVYTRLKNGFMLTYCSSIIRGLPDWARKLEKQQHRNGKEMNKLLICTCLIAGFFRENMVNYILFEESMIGICVNYFFDFLPFNCCLDNYNNVEDEYYKELRDINY